MRDVGNWAEDGVENRKGAGQGVRDGGENKGKTRIKKNRNRSRKRP